MQFVDYLLFEILDAYSQDVALISTIIVQQILMSVFNSQHIWLDRPVASAGLSLSNPFDEFYAL